MRLLCLGFTLSGILGLFAAFGVVSSAEDGQQAQDQRGPKAARLNAAGAKAERWNGVVKLERNRTRMTAHRSRTIPELKTLARSVGFSDSELANANPSNALSLDGGNPAAEKGALKGRLVANNVSLWQADIPTPMPNWPTLPPVIELKPGGALNVAFMGAPGQLCVVTVSGAIDVPSGKTAKVKVSGGPMTAVLELGDGPQDIPLFTPASPDPSEWNIITLEVLAPTTTLAIAKCEITVLGS